MVLSSLIVTAFSISILRRFPAGNYIIFVVANSENIFVKKSDIQRPDNYRLFSSEQPTFGVHKKSYISVEI